MSDTVGEDDTLTLRTRFYSSMNYNQYVAVFDKPPSKPSLKPLLKVLEEDLKDFHLEDEGNIAKDSLNSDQDDLPEIRKPSLSVNFTIGKHKSEVKQLKPLEIGEEFNLEQLKIDEEAEEEQDEFEQIFKRNPTIEKNSLNRNRSQTESHNKSILEFLGTRSRKQSLAS